MLSLKAGLAVKLVFTGVRNAGLKVEVISIVFLGPSSCAYAAATMNDKKTTLTIFFICLL
jgi:hypothetical protein